jgi:hypothetical protein
MNVALWIVASFLAAVFLMAGGGKLVTEKKALEARMPWAADFTAAQIRRIGAVELLGAVGLILPAVLDIAPILVPIAAVGLAVTMACAVLVHLRRGDGVAAAAPAAVLGLLALFVAVGRFGPQPF